MKSYLWAVATLTALWGVLSSCKSHPSLVGVNELSISITSERIERGKYLANHVAVCMDCHSQRDYTLFAAPIVAGSLGAGGQVFDHKMGLPGTFYGKNLTSATLKNWTDAEVYRAITTGISKDGTALLPMMPYQNYGKMDSEDIKSIIAYLRTLPSVENVVPASKPDFWVKPIIKQITKMAKPQPKPALQDTLAYGKYLLSFAGCTDCHTQRRMGIPIKGKELAGGMAFPLPSGIVKSANLTPDPKTGIGTWTKDAFIARFKAFNANTFTPFETKGGFNTPMPWTFYSGMNEEDLGAIFTYLKSLKPIDNQVIKFKPSSLAKRYGGEKAK